MQYRKTRFSLLPAVLIGVLSAPAFAQTPTTMSAKAAPGTPTVAHAVFALGIQARTPVNPVTTLTNNVQRIYYFTDLRNMAGQTVTDSWTYNGVVMAKVTFHVGGPRWRVWSTKTLLPGQLGTWTVTVVDAQGNVLAKNSFTYVKAASPANGSPAAAPQPTGGPGQ